VNATRSTLLLVDDDAHVLSAYRRILRADHEVMVATSAEAAAALIDSGARPDVILCDLTMPGMGGQGLHAHLFEHLPALAERILFLTGGVYTAEAIQFAEEHRERVLAKPISSAELRARIRSHLREIA
jgi:DNA-binding response OmpR family regulator